MMGDHLSSFVINVYAGPGRISHPGDNSRQAIKYVLWYNQPESDRASRADQPMSNQRFTLYGRPGRSVRPAMQIHWAQGRSHMRWACKPQGAHPGSSAQTRFELFHPWILKPASWGLRVETKTRSAD